MIRPLTCLSLAAALGAGLYLYQEKHRAQLLDREITRTVKQAEQARDRIGLLKAEWALLNEPDRLAGLATQHLQLQTLSPTQFVRLEDLRSRLPAIVAAPAAPAAPAAMDEPPVAAASQPAANALAAARPPVVASAAPAGPPLPTAPGVTPAAALPVQLAANRPPHLPVHAPAAGKPRDADAAPRLAEQERRPLFAPVMHAYAPTPTPMVHAPTLQTASAMAPQPMPFVGSALGMGRTVLAAPVPVSPAR